MPKKRKAKAQPIAQPKENKVAKPTQAKPTILVTRDTTRPSTQRAKEQDKEKKVTKLTSHVQKKPNRKYVAQPEFDDEERIESEDIS